MPGLIEVASTQNMYSASLLYILSVCTSKLSLAIFVRGLTPVSRDHFLARLVEITVNIWGVIAIFGTAFQCAVPRTWDFWNGNCFDLVYILTIFNPFTVLMDFEHFRLHGIILSAYRISQQIF